MVNFRGLRTIMMIEVQYEAKLPRSLTSGEFEFFYATGIKLTLVRDYEVRCIETLERYFDVQRIRVLGEAATWDSYWSVSDTALFYQVAPVLRRSTLTVVDNHRVLHGRAAFTGKRRMCGAYIGTDDYLARLHALRARGKESGHWSL